MKFGTTTAKIIVNPETLPDDIVFDETLGLFDEAVREQSQRQSSSFEVDPGYFDEESIKICWEVEVTQTLANSIHLNARWLTKQLKPSLEALVTATMTCEMVSRLHVHALSESMSSAALNLYMHSTSSFHHESSEEEWLHE